MAGRTEQSPAVKPGASSTNGRVLLPPVSRPFLAPAAAYPTASGCRRGFSSRHPLSRRVMSFSCFTTPPCKPHVPETITPPRLRLPHAVAFIEFYHVPRLQIVPSPRRVAAASCSEDSQRAANAVARGRSTPIELQSRVPRAMLARPAKTRTT